jgi:hypothetical protein
MRLFPIYFYAPFTYLQVIVMSIVSKWLVIGRFKPGQYSMGFLYL